MLGIFETAQIAHDGVGKGLKRRDLSEAVVLALDAGKLKYDRRGDTIKVNVQTRHYILTSRRIYPPCFGLVEDSAFLRRH